MYGWRARLGIMIPSTNYTMEPELNRNILEGISLHFARLKTGGAFDVHSLVAMADQTVKCAEELKTVSDVMAYACTSSSFVMGRGWDENIIARIKSVTDKPVTTTSTSLLNALQTFQVKKISLATPYTEEVNERQRDFFNANGFEVVKMKGLGIDQHGGQGIFYPQRAYMLAKDVDDPRAELVLISCTNFRTFEIIDALEKDIKKPVLTSNQATLWKLLRLVGIYEKIDSLGSLLREF